MRNITLFYLYVSHRTIPLSIESVVIVNAVVASSPSLSFSSSSSSPSSPTVLFACRYRCMCFFLVSLLALCRSHYRRETLRIFLSLSLALSLSLSLLLCEPYFIWFHTSRIFLSFSLSLPSFSCSVQKRYLSVWRQTNDWNRLRTGVILPLLIFPFF